MIIPPMEKVPGDKFPKKPLEPSNVVFTDDCEVPMPTLGEFKFIGFVTIVGTIIMTGMLLGVGI